MNNQRSNTAEHFHIFRIMVLTLSVISRANEFRSRFEHFPLLVFIGLSKFVLILRKIYNESYLLSLRPFVRMLENRFVIRLITADNEGTFRSRVSIVICEDNPWVFEKEIHIAFLNV